jgi:hypothetical protein
MSDVPTDSMKHVSSPGVEPVETLHNLAMAVPPKWGEAILRLAQATERVAAKLDELPASATHEHYIPKARALAKSLIDFLDALEEDSDLEPTLGYMNGPPEMDECETPEDAEPSLGSFDRMVDQEKSWRTFDRDPDIYGWSGGCDNELDDCDYEDSDPAEESEASGIGDQDGLDEQVPFRDWQGVGMV